MTTVVDSQPLLTAIDSALTTAGVAFDVGRKPTDATTRYVVAWPDGGNVENRSLKSRDGWSTVIAFQCYGLTAEAANYAVRKLREAVLGLHLTTVGGRQVQMPEHQPPPPLSRDDDADPALFMQYDEWRIRTS